MRIVTGGTKAVSFGKPKGLFITPWVKKNNKWVLGADTYDIGAIVANTTAITQADPNTEKIDHEFSDNPLKSITTLGIKTFSADCTDFSHQIMASLFGCTTSAEGDIVAFPEQYSDLYCMIRLTFEEGQDIIMPFVSMASKAVFEQMKTGVAKGTITGTCESATMRFKKVTISPETQEEQVSDYLVIGGGSEKHASSSMFFMNQGYKFEVLDYHTNDDIQAAGNWATESTEQGDLVP